MVRNQLPAPSGLKETPWKPPEAISCDVRALSAITIRFGKSFLSDFHVGFAVGLAPMLRNRFIVPDWHCFTVQVCTITYVYANASPLPRRRTSRSKGSKGESSLRSDFRGKERPRCILFVDLIEASTITITYKRETQYLVYRADPRGLAFLAPLLLLLFRGTVSQLDPLLIDLSPNVNLVSNDRPKIATNGELEKYPRNPVDFYRCRRLFYFFVLRSHHRTAIESSMVFFLIFVISCFLFNW